MDYTSPHGRPPWRLTVTRTEKLANKDEVTLVIGKAEPGIEFLFLISNSLEILHNKLINITFGFKEREANEKLIQVFTALSKYYLI